jgi:cytochrome b561
MPKWQATASHVSHWSLYALLFAIPITGWLMSSASAYSVSWFSLFQLPDFVAPNPELKEIFEETHETLAKLLAVIASVHIIAAIKHAVIDKDDILSRMVSSISLALFVIVAALGAAWLGNVGSSSDSTSDTTPGAATNSSAVVEAPVANSDLPMWQIDYTASYIKFSGDQAGAEFEGVWETWSADMQFDADNLDGSVFYVTVDTASGNTQDADRDGTLTDPEWFDTINFPEAYLRTSDFTRSEDDYIASGQLIIKGIASPVQLMFTVAANGDKRVLTGTAQLDRLALGVGTGEWEDTEWVGKDVRVQVRIEATLRR